MIRMLNIKLFIVSILLLLSAGFVAVPAWSAMPVRRVPLNDEIALLNAQDSLAVKRISQELYRDLKSELAVLIIRSTKGENASDYALRVFNHWGLGQAAVNNGMLIVFAIDDRRVEIKPGTRYKSRFTESFCTSLLTRYVVPEMRAGRPEKGVLAAAREVAAEIRRVEGNSANPGVNSVSHQAEMPQTVTTSQKPAATSSAVPARSRNTSVGARYQTGGERFRVNLEWLKFGFYGLVILGVAFGVFYYIKAFQHGVLLMPAWMFALLMILAALLTGALGFLAADVSENVVDQGFAGTGSVFLIFFLWGSSHICPRCNRYMSVWTRTLHYATYHSSGLGEKTVHCDSCNYHHVGTYTIARKTKSHSSSSSGRSSGGRSSGGGGGASW